MVFCGTDIIEVDRIKGSVEKFNNDFLDKIFTVKEQQYCEAKNNAKFQHYAGRFAAKEAVYKALSPDIPICFTDIEILNNEKGKPYVILHNKLSIYGNNIDISISHAKEYAIAYAILEVRN